MRGDVPWYLIAIILALIVLIAFVFLIGGAKGSADITIKQNVLRQCCSDRAIFDCIPTHIDAVNCPTPWGSQSLRSLANEIGLSDDEAIIEFCNC